MTTSPPSGPLVGLRVVEWGHDIVAPYAARLLADLGAEVIKVETSGGDPSRRHGPFPRQPENDDESGLFHALNAGKRGVLLDPDTETGRRQLVDLVGQADIFVTDRAAERFGVLDLAADRLSARFPQLVVAIGSTFGRSTPSLDEPDATALHVSAVTGFSSVIGHPARMPLPLPADLPDYVAGANLAAAAVAAHFGAVRSGRGQVVEVASSEVLFYIGVVLSTLVSLGAPRAYRSGRAMPGSGGAYPFRFFPTADGAVAVACRSSRDWSALLKLVGSPEWAEGPGWDDPFVIARTMSDEADRHLEPWFRGRRSEDLFATARRLGLPLAPVRAIADLLAEPQFAHRESFSDPVPVGDAAIRFLRGPARFSRTPVSRVVAAGPPVSAVEGSVAFSGDPHAERTDAPRPTHAVGTPLLQGIRVLDLSWVWSGPMAAATLADLGAEVIKIEHRGRLDNARLRGRPMRDGAPMEGPVEELSIYFHQNNRGKMSVDVDLKQPEGRRLFRQLAATADIIVDNLTPGTFDKLDVGFDALSSENPRLIWLAMSAAGRDGPLAGMRAYAPIMSAMAGLEALVGYPDDPIVGMINGGIADPNASSHALLAVLAALVEREHSGRGQFIDLSQIEAMVSAMCEPLVEYMINGREPEALAAGHRRHVPHGHYPCRGEDAWVAISIVDDDGWRRLAAAMGHPELSTADGFATSAARRSRRDEIDELVTAWTTTRTIDEAVGELSGARITAVQVLDVVGARRVFGSLLTKCDHPVTGTEELACVPWRFADTPARVASNAPLVGQHTAEIVADLAAHHSFAPPAHAGAS